jgi:hypothetical protein
MTNDSFNISQVDQPTATKDFPEKPTNSLKLQDKVLLPLSRTQEDIENNAQNRRQPNLLGHMLITSSLAISIFLLWSSLNWFAGNKAKEWLVQSTVNPQPIFTENFKSKPAVKERLNQQFDDIQSRIKSHSDVMIYFYKQSYVCGSMSLGLAITSALCIFFISRDGWEKANNGLINAFLVTTSAAFVCNQIPVIFKQENNLTGNRTLYLEYVALRNEFISYAATGGTIGGEAAHPGDFTTVDANQFIHQIDRRLAELNQIAIDFDLSRVADVPEFQPGNLRVAPSLSKTPVAVPKSSPAASPK